MQSRGRADGSYEIVELGLYMKEDWWLQVKKKKRIAKKRRAGRMPGKHQWRKSDWNMGRTLRQNKR